MTRVCPTCSIFKPKLLQFTENKRKPILEILSVLGNGDHGQALCSLGPHPHLAAKAGHSLQEEVPLPNRAPNGSFSHQVALSTDQTTRK